MGCLCNLFENETLWLIILSLLILSLFCNGGCGGYNGCGFTPASREGCGCGCGH